MAILRKRPIPYNVGFVLYFIALVLFCGSLAIPGIWFSLKESEGSEKSEGHSIWRLDFQTCLEGHGHKLGWRCEKFPADYAKGKASVIVRRRSRRIEICHCHRFCQR